jgi:hypothetical protein
MNFINLAVSSLDAPAFIMAGDRERSTWLCLLRFCVVQENGGVIEGAKEWPARIWDQAVRVRSVDVGRASGLWSWRGDDLVVNFYPQEQQDWVEVRRKSASLAARARWKRGSKMRSHMRSQCVTHSESDATAMRDGMRDDDVTQCATQCHSKLVSKIVSEGMPADSASEAEIPSWEEVERWAEMRGVMKEYARERWARLNEEHGWVKNGRLLEWQKRLWRYWQEDREGWLRKNGKGTGGGGQQERVEEIRALLQADPDGPGAAGLRAELKRIRGEV